jgi:ParB family chromosome partitioning protein
MTDTAVTTTEEPIGALEYLDPATLEIGDNVRDEAALSKDFVASIAEHGVLVPITGVRRADGEAVVVRNGQRRTLAAREAGLASVPVYVLPYSAADASQDAVDRIVHQIVTNDQKHDLTDAQRARGIQQMIDAGMSVTKVAKKLSVHKNTVKAAEVAAKSSTAMDILASGQLSLTEAAAFTEFEDLPFALEKLTAAAGSPRFDHVVAQLRQDRTSYEARVKAAAEYTEQGFTVLDERPWWSGPAYVPAHHLSTADGGSVEGLEVNNPAQWAVYLCEDTEIIDAETGEPVEEETVDWNTEGDPEAVPAEGLRHADTVTDAPVFLPLYYCLDPDAAGLTVDEGFARRAGMSTAGSSDDAEADADAAAAAQAEAEARETRERRKVLALNKLGAAAQIVRREFVTKLLARKTPAKGAAVFVADCLARDAHLPTYNRAAETAAELLGVDGGAPGLRTMTGALGTGADARAQVVVLGLVLGALEAKTGKDAWRGTGSWGGVTSGDYLRFLAEQGYALAAIEEVITGARTADDVYDEYLADKQ